MVRAKLWLVTAAALIACCAAPAAWADLAVPGNYQTAGGYGSDWSPNNAPLMNDLTGGLFDLSLTGLAASTRYEFKIVDDEGTPPPAWGDPEVPNNGAGSPNTWFRTNAGGSATIMLDRNTYSDGFLPATDRIVVSTDSTEFASFFATGDWMNEAGGAGDWNPADPAFAMTAQGGGLWSLGAVISAPGSYLYKATGGGWDSQWGTNGRLGDAANMAFSTTVANEPVTFLLDVSKGAISIGRIPEPSTLVLFGLALAGLACGRKR
jgi:hypothetical protein